MVKIADILGYIVLENISKPKDVEHSRKKVSQKSESKYSLRK